MQNNPTYSDVVMELGKRLDITARRLLDLGLEPEMILTDPGIGFGKLLEHNLSLLAAGNSPKSKIPLIWGVSRKRMFADLLGRMDSKDRLSGSLECLYGPIKGSRYHQDSRCARAYRFV